MELRYDASADAAYIDLTEREGAASFGFSYECNPAEVNGQIHLNFDLNGRLMGIEVLDASKKLPASLLKNATR
ncbi:MAG: DUF2283 domain-containing protein [Pseudomonadota bacterium]